MSVGSGPTALRFTQDLLLIRRERGRVFATSKFSGICGLGFPELAFPDVTPLFDSMMKEHPSVTSFSFFFSDRLAKDGVSSELHFGPPKSDYYVGCLQYVPVTKRYYWETRLQGIFLLPQNKPDVDSNYVPALSKKLLNRYFRRRDDVTSTAGTGMKAAVDSGTSLMAGPRRVVRSVVRRIKEMSGVDIMNHHGHGCDHAKMPEIVLRMGLSDAKAGAQVDFVLHPEDYFPFRAGSSTRCWSGIMSLDVGPPKGPLMVLGDGEPSAVQCSDRPTYIETQPFFFLHTSRAHTVFMRKFYSVFDRKHMRMGFAVAKHPGATRTDEQAVAARKTRVKGSARPDNEGKCGDGAFFQTEAAIVSEEGN